MSNTLPEPAKRNDKVQNCNSQVYETNKPLEKSKKDKEQSNWSRLFRPWKWKKKKKSEKFVNVAATLERKISVRSSKEDLIRRGVLNDVDGKSTNDNYQVPSGEVRTTSDQHSTYNNYVASETEDNLPATNLDQVKTNDFKKPRNPEHNSSLKRTAPIYIHHKYPSDEVSRLSREVIRQSRKNQNRHSYQMATTSDSPINDSPEFNPNQKRELYEKNFNKPFVSQMQPQQSHLKTISLHTVPQSVSKSAYSVVSQPPSSTTTKKPWNNQNTTTDYEQKYLSKPDYENRKYTYSHSRSASMQHITELQPSVPLGRASGDFSLKTYSNTNFESEAMNRLHLNSDAKEKNQQNSINSYQRGPPPKPPPKPSKCNQHLKFSDPYPPKMSSSSSHQPPPPPPQADKPSNRENQTSRSYATNQPLGVVFAESAEIFQRTTQISIPQYILDKFHSTSDEPTSDESLRITGSRGTADDDQDSDSDSLGPIQYRDSFDQFRNLSNQAQNGDSSDEDEDISPIQGGLAAKVARRDTLAQRLGNQTEKMLSPTAAHVAKEISVSKKSEEEKSAIRSNLTRRLSQRPTKSELEQRNILPQDSPEDRHKEREKVKRQLSRKLSMRPTVKDLVDRKVLINWHEYVEVYQAQDYDRKGDKPWTRLTPADKASIRKELNEFKKNEMQVHEESRHYTRFHKP